MCTIFEKMQKLTEDQRELMSCLYDSMPESDRGYPFELLLSVVDHSLMLRETASWCRELPDWMFREYVLYHRVNDEDISNLRPVFYRELWDRVKGLAVEEAVLEVNRWCHEKATYQKQDDRTASPATVYRSGSGRCGEESAFAVTALRSVGIAARQIYAPRWSHCDDNHAWVEAFCDGQWKFFGACEPEPVLDKGWFNAAAARAMLVHSRTFGRTEQDSQALGREGSVSYWNQTSRYANTKIWTFQVTENGLPVAPPEGSAWLRLSVLNEGRFMSIAELPLDEQGLVSVELGIGDIWAEAVYQGKRAELLCKGNKFSSFTIEMCSGKPGSAETGSEEAGLGAVNAQPEQGIAWQDFDFLAPTGTGRTAPVLNQEEKRAREAATQRGSALRTDRQQRYLEEGQAALLHLFANDRRPVTELREIIALSRGNWQQLIAFLKSGHEQERIWLLRQLADKDYRDVTAVVLEDHLHGALPHKDAYPEDVFQQAVLNPRIAYERLTPWRNALLTRVGEEQAVRFREKPASVVEYLQKKVTVVADGIYPSLYFDPVFALAHGRCDAKSRRVLAVALLRCAGVAARLSRKDQSLEYYDGGTDQFVTVPWTGGETAQSALEQATRSQTGSSQAARSEAICEPACLVLKKDSGQVFTYRQNWSLSRLEHGQWTWLDLSDESFGEENVLRLSLPEGTYRILTANRLPKGDQLASCCNFTLRAGEEREIRLQLRSYSVREMLGEYAMPAFTALDEAGNLVESQALTGSGATDSSRFTADGMPTVDTRSAANRKPSLLFWLEEGAEPTEHVVNEWIAHLKESVGNGAENGRGIVEEADVVFFLRSKEAKKQSTLAGLLDIWPEVRLLYGDWEFNMELMARHLSCNPEQPPLAVVVNGRGNCVYASSGYNVGLVKLLLEMARLTGEI